MICPAGPEQPILDGYGVPYDPGLHKLYVEIGIRSMTSHVTTPPPVEPIWKDRPAGCRKCIPLYEDKDCEQFPA